MNNEGKLKRERLERWEDESFERVEFAHSLG